MANSSLLKYQTPADILAHCVPSENGCIEWRGPTGSNSFGQIHFRGVSTRASRAMWQLSNGPIPDGLVVMHSCDNPPCVNIDHLSLGTNRENIDDMLRKGRSAKGDKNGRRRHPERFKHVRILGTQSKSSKINEDIVRQIRASSLTLSEDAARFGISDVAVSKVRRRKLWAWVQ